MVTIAQEKISTMKINYRREKVADHDDDDDANTVVCRESGFLHRYRKVVFQF